MESAKSLTCSIFIFVVVGAFSGAKVVKIIDICKLKCYSHAKTDKVGRYLLNI